VVSGVIVGGLLVYSVEAAGHMVYPPPAGLDAKNAEAMKSYVSQLPVGAFLFVLAAWIAGAFGGAFTAAKIAARRRFALGFIVGLLTLAAGIANLVIIPHPMWFAVSAVVLVGTAAYGGAQVGAGSTR
jgi:hypothetical protein